MESNQEPARPERRARRSTRIGILALIGIVILAIAIVWGIQRLSDDDDGNDAPSVSSPTELVARSGSDSLLTAA